MDLDPPTHFHFLTLQHPLYQCLLEVKPLPPSPISGVACGLMSVSKQHNMTFILPEQFSSWFWYTICLIFLFNLGILAINITDYSKLNILNIRPL